MCSKARTPPCRCCSRAVPAVMHGRLGALGDAFLPCNRSPRARKLKTDRKTVQTENKDSFHGRIFIVIETSPILSDGDLILHQITKTI